MFKIYLCIGALKYLNDTKVLASSEATMVIGIYDPSIDFYVYTDIYKYSM